MRVLRALARSPRARPGMIALSLLVAFSLLAPLALPPPDASDFALARAADGGPPGPSLAHPLGVDSLLRDVLSRLAAGGRASLAIAVTAAAIASTVGALVGVAAATAARGRARVLDRIAVRVIDVLLALPFLLVVTAIGSAFGRSDGVTLLAVLGGIGWAGTARVVRARAAVVLEQPFVAAARAIGASPLRIALRHVLPSVAGLWIVVATGTVGSMILAEAVLGYLGVGLPPPHASWGRTLHEAESLLAIRPLLVAAPGICIVLAALSWNRLGEGLRDALGGDEERGPAPPSGAWDIGLALAAFAGAILVSPAAPGPPVAAAEDETPVRGGTLRVATTVAIRQLDPALAYDEPSGAIGRLVWERLLEIEDDGRVVPRLATSHAWSDGGRTLELELRPDARFHDGEPVLSRDVKRSIERALHPKSPSPGASYFERIEGFAEFRAGKAEALAGIETPAPHRVRFRLDRPSGGFLALLSLGFAAPVCRDAGSPAGSPTGSHADPRGALPCGAGPFRIVSVVAEEGLRLERHEGYDVPGVPLLDAIDWRFNVRSVAQRFKLEQGELDLSRDLNPTDSALFEASPAWRGLGNWVVGRTMSAVFMNVEMPPFDREAVRRAVRLALDPEALRRIRPDVLPLDRVVPPTVPGAPRGGQLRVHDLPAALEEMREAGLPYDPEADRGGWEPPIDYVTVADSFEQAASEVYQQQLARIGLRLRLRTTTFPTYLAEAKSRGRSPMGWVGWGADYPDPLNFFEPTLSSRAIGDPSENFSFFSDPELDRVLVDADRTIDPTEREALIGRAERIVFERAPWVPTFAARTFVVRQPRLRGYQPSASSMAAFESVWLAREPGAPTPLALGHRPGGAP